MLYTRKGDSGTSGLFGTTRRYPKNSPFYEALGTLDELNSLLGVCRAYSSEYSGDTIIQKEIERAQEAIFIIQAEIAGSKLHITKKHVETLEKIINDIEMRVGNPYAFVIPGATIVSAYLDFGRTVARRAERSTIASHKNRRISPESLAYLNRLSSLLYALARYAAAKEGVKELSPSYT